MVTHEEIQCPVCGYYCLGKGGVGCIDKPNLGKIIAPAGEMQILKQPVIVGGYRIGSDGTNVTFNFDTKPTWLHRKMSALLLGWVWVDV